MQSNNSFTEQAERYLIRGWAYSHDIEFIIDDFNKGFLKKDDAIADIVKILENKNGK